MYTRNYRKQRKELKAKITINAEDAVRVEIRGDSPEGRRKSMYRKDL